MIASSLKKTGISVYACAHAKGHAKVSLLEENKVNRTVLMVQCMLLRESLAFHKLSLEVNVVIEDLI